MDLTSKLHAKMHYEAGSHRRKLRKAVVNYCRANDLPVPAEYRKDATANGGDVSSILREELFVNHQIVKLSSDPSIV